jgi:hypothetical protein
VGGLLLPVDQHFAGVREKPFDGGSQQIRKEENKQNVQHQAW